MYRLKIHDLFEQFSCFTTSSKKNLKKKQTEKQKHPPSTKKQQKTTGKIQLPPPNIGNYL